MSVGICHRRMLFYRSPEFEHVAVSLDYFSKHLTLFSEREVTTELSVASPYLTSTYLLNNSSGYDSHRLPVPTAALRVLPTLAKRYSSQRRQFHPIREFRNLPSLRTEGQLRKRTTRRSARLGYMSTYQKLKRNRILQNIKTFHIILWVHNNCWVFFFYLAHHAEIHFVDHLMRRKFI